MVNTLQLAPDRCAFDKMREMYAELNLKTEQRLREALERGATDKEIMEIQGLRLSFEDDLIEYHRNGIVRSSPKSMVFAMIGRDEKGDFWFIRAAVGDIQEMLLMLLPWYLPRIKWWRRNEPKMKEWRTDRLYSLAMSLRLKGEQSWVAAA